MSREILYSRSAEFKKQAWRTLFSVFLFFLVYLALILCAILIGLALLTLGGLLIMSVANFFTLIIGLGILGCVFFILFFLFQFIFKKYKTDLSHLHELSPNDQPELFATIERIVKEANSKHPKKVYLSGEVNASVFYNSSFWSMFFPVRKNLQIGMGLLVSNTVKEFEAILAHEFGHFTQKSMKIGSYVYNVNLVIRTMLFDNESLAGMANKWGNVHGAIQLGVVLAIHIIRRFQEALRWVYKVLNKNFMAMSREMEFHADAMAAGITSPSAFATGLMRIEITQHDLNEVFAFYAPKIKDGAWTENFYPQFKIVNQYLNQLRRLPATNSLAFISSVDYQRLQGTKIVISDPWSSHPSIEERVGAVLSGSVPLFEQDILAITLLRNIKVWQESLTAQVFAEWGTDKTKAPVSDDQFAKAYIEKIREQSPDPVFNDYYLRKNPPELNEDQVMEIGLVGSFKELFSDEIVRRQQELFTLSDDIIVLKEFSKTGQQQIKLKYDGREYLPADIESLIAVLNTREEEEKEVIRQNDIKIYSWFLGEARRLGQEEKLKKLQLACFTAGKVLEDQMDLYGQMKVLCQEMTALERKEDIAKKVEEIYVVEVDFKKKISNMLLLRENGKHIEPDIRVMLKEYVENHYPYFKNEFHYAAIERMTKCLRVFPAVAYRPFQEARLEYLNYVAQLAK